MAKVPKEALPYPEFPLERYMRMCRESEGFDVCDGGRHLAGGIGEITKNYRENFKEAADIAKCAVRQYNKTRNCDLVFHSLVKANWQVVSGAMYYLTFKARHPTDRRLTIFQAKVWNTVGNKISISIFRQHPKFESPSKLSTSFEPITEAEPTAIEPVSNFKEEEDKRPSVPKGAFFSFTSDLRKLPELANTSKKEVTRIASMKWKSMSVEEKLEHNQSRILKYEDIAGFVSAIQH